MGYEATQAQLLSGKLHSPTPQGWGFSANDHLLVPPYCLAVIVAITVAFVSDKTKMRGIYLATFTLLGIIGFAVLRAAPPANIKYMAVFFSTAVR